MGTLDSATQQVPLSSRADSIALVHANNATVTVVDELYKSVSVLVETTHTMSSKSQPCQRRPLLLTVPATNGSDVVVASHRIAGPSTGRDAPER